MKKAIETQEQLLGKLLESASASLSAPSPSLSAAESLQKGSLLNLSA